MLSSVKLRLEELSSQQQQLSDELDPTRQSRFLDFYVRWIPRMLDAERCSVFIHDPANNKVWLKAGTALRERGIEVSTKDSIVGEVIASGKPVVATELQSRPGAHKTIDTTTGFVTREVVCVPIRGTDGTKVTGAIQVLNKKSGGRFSEEDQSFLVEVGEHFQGIVESIFLGQEAIRMTRSAVVTASRAVLASFIAIFASIFIVTVFGIFGAVKPWFVESPVAQQQAMPADRAAGGDIRR